MKLQIGNKAPLFSLPDENGTVFNLNDLIGKKQIVLFFYPKDNSPGCTMEACSFRDSYQDFQDLGAEVIGISKDGKDSHKDFKSQRKLPFQLLSDEDGTVHEQYGIKKVLFLIPGRKTFLIGLDGHIKLIFDSAIDMSGHQEKMLEYLKGA